MKKLITLSIIALLTLTLFAPLTLQSQLLTNVYYLNVELGKYYAVYTGGVPYRIFYVDNNGNTIYVSGYWWDANTSYIIFQSPINGKVYFRQESYTLSTLNTKPWFLNIDIPSSITITLKLYDGNNNYYGVSISRTANYVGSTTYVFTGSKLIVRVNASYKTDASVSTYPCFTVSASPTGTWFFKIDNPSTYVVSYVYQIKIYTSYSQTQSRICYYRSGSYYTQTIT